MRNTKCNHSTPSKCSNHCKPQQGSVMAAPTMSPTTKFDCVVLQQSDKSKHSGVQFRTSMPSMSMIVMQSAGGLMILSATWNGHLVRPTHSCNLAHGSMATKVQMNTITCTIVHQISTNLLNNFWIFPCGPGTFFLCVSTEESCAIFVCVINCSFSCNTMRLQAV